MEANLDLLIPALFVATAAAVSIVSMSFMKRRWARELEAMRTTASLLGLELKEGLDAVREVYEEDGSPQAAAALERLPKPILKLLSLGAQWRLEGERGGFRVAVHPETRQSGKSSTTYTVARAYFGEELGYDLTVQREGALFKLGKALFGASEVELGDPALDPRVKIKASDPAAAQALLGGEEARRVLGALCDAKGDFRVTRGYAHWEIRGVVTEPGELGSALDLLVRLASSLER
jgi:hypothetical protein